MNLFNKTKKEKVYTSSERQYIEAVMRRTLLPFDVVAKKMENDKKKFGITFEDYYTNAFWKVSDDVKGAKYAAVLKAKYEKKLEKEKIQLIRMAKVIHATGWSYEYALEKYMDCKKRTTASWSEYLFYHMYELDDATQEEVFLLKHSNMLFNRYNPPKKLGEPAITKISNCLEYGKWFNREWCSSKDLCKEDVLARFKGKKRVIYKPLRGSGGQGVEVFDFNDDNIKEVFEKISNLPEGLIEEYLVQHYDLSRICPSSVNTIRFGTVSSQTKKVTADGKDHDIMYASLRIGRMGKHVDNFHSGGMVVGIDLETGTVITDAADGEGKFYSEHPDTGVKFIGFKVPYFKEAVAMINDIIETTKIEGYIGWDVAISEKGPMLIEKNGRPGSMLFASPYITQKKGTMDVIRKYLWE